MPHLRGKRSLEARRKRSQEYRELFGHPTKRFYQRKKFLASFSEDTQTLTTREKDVLRSRVRKCKICGWDHHPEVLIIHHINKNKRDNRLSNLVVLCRNCHYLLHRELAILPEEDGNDT